MVINDLENLDKVSETQEEKARWRKIFDEENAAKKILEIHNTGAERLQLILTTAQKELERLDKTWPEKLVAIVMGEDSETLAFLNLSEPKVRDYPEKKAKILAAHRARAKELQELIQDCKEALGVIQKAEGEFKDIFREANFARNIIYQRRMKKD